MAVFACFPDGRRERLSERYGATIEDVVASLTAGSLTGSAVPLSEAVLVLATGEHVPYSTLRGFEEEQAFA